MVKIKTVGYKGNPVNIGKLTELDVPNITAGRTDYEIIGIVIREYKLGDPERVSVTRQTRKNNHTWEASFYNAHNASIDFYIDMVVVDTSP